MSAIVAVVAIIVIAFVAYVGVMMFRNQAPADGGPGINVNLGTDNGGATGNTGY